MLQSIELDNANLPSDLGTLRVELLIFRPLPRALPWHYQPEAMNPASLRLHT